MHAEAKICTHICANPSSPRRASLDIRVDAQAFLRKAVPYVAEVLTAGKDLVRLNDRITRVKEARTTLVYLHGIQHELGDERISVLRNKWSWYVRRTGLWCAVEVTKRNCAIFKRSWREERLDKAVLRNQSLGNNPEHLCQDFTDRVNTPVLRLIKRLVRGRVDSFVLYSSQN